MKALLHFIKWDIISFKIYWILLATASISIVLFFGTSADSARMLLFLFFMFGIVPTHHITGSKLRSQHVMSRSYLLSLPIKRQTLFFYIIIRKLVFYLPLILLFYCLPKLAVSTISPVFAKTDFTNLSFYFLVPVLIVLFILLGLQNKLETEKLSAHTTTDKRFFSWIVLFSRSGLLFLCVALVLSFPQPLASVSLALIASVQAYYCSRKWVTL
ncbi:MAG: hypothetical protein JST80_04290 [Bdellovibrionales bacterium]|nr:hypothetical protein [Bdellovibrionales bacterium]